MPIYWTTDRHVCEGCEAVFLSDDELQSRCPTCEAAYQRDYAHYKGLFEAERRSRHNAEGLRLRVPEWRRDRG